MNILYIVVLIVALLVIAYFYLNTEKKGVNSKLEEKLKIEFGQTLKMAEWVIHYRESMSYDVETKVDDNSIFYSSRDDYGSYSVLYRKREDGWFRVSAKAEPKSGVGVGATMSFDPEVAFDGRIKTLVSKWNRNLDSKYRKDSKFYKRLVLLIRGINDEDFHKY